MKKVLKLALTGVVVLSMTACSSAKSTTTETSGSSTETPAATTAATYTYHGYQGALATNWNPHTWEMSSDSAVLDYITTPFVTMSVENSEEGVYQWVYSAATSVTDVTADHQDDLTKYGAVLADGEETATEGYVYEIALNPEMRWEDGTQINADSYVYSMQQLLNPEMLNYRANTYYSGESAIAGALNYYYQGSSVKIENATGDYYEIADLSVDADGNYVTADGNPVYIAVSASLSEWLGGYSLYDYVDAYGEDVFNLENWEALCDLQDEEGYVVANETTVGYLASVISTDDWGEDESCVPAYLYYNQVFGEASWDSVGLYKVDDYTIRYVCQTYLDKNYFLGNLTSNWLVYESVYEANKDTAGTLVTTSYGTSVDTTKSYGPYKLSSLQDDKQMVFVQNPEWFGYEAQEDGSLVGTSWWLVDGEYKQIYQTTSVVIDVMDDDAAKQAFMKGELSGWTPAADDLSTYSLSDNLYKADETYTMRFFFDTNVDDLKEMDNSKGNTNSVVLTNYNFRKAFSLAMDRTEFVGATSGYKAAYSMLNSLYMYDAYNDPTSSYRNSDAAKQAICNLYGVEYGTGTAYADLNAAYSSINGYNLTEAKELMKTACEELVADGLYTAGDPIYIRIAWSAGAITSDYQQQCALMQKYINAAAEGSGFGEITFEPIGNITNRYDAVPNGEYAIGYGAWGGAAFYPFTMFQVYCDPDYTTLNEGACWDPTTTPLTLNVDGEEVTMTWQAWSGAMSGVGAFATTSFETKLSILAQLEENYLNLMYCIPICSTTACEMLSYQVNYYTDNYNIMYGFGGFDLMSYNYSDAEWADYVASQGGTLSYE